MKILKTKNSNNVAISNQAAGVHIGCIRIALCNFHPGVRISDVCWLCWLGRMSFISGGAGGLGLAFLGAFKKNRPLFVGQEAARGCAKALLELLYCIPCNR